MKADEEKKEKRNFPGKTGDCMMKDVALLFEQVRGKIRLIRNNEVILDSDVAALYGVETKRVNEAVRNNPDKFPEDYMFRLTEDELAYLRSKLSTANISSKSRVCPAAFTEKGLYMLATILKSKQAVNATFAIIETFAKHSVKRVKRQNDQDRFETE